MIGFKDGHIFVGPKLPPFGFNGWSPEALPGRLQDHEKRPCCRKKFSMDDGWNKVGQELICKISTNKTVNPVSRRYLDSEDQREVRQATSFDRANVWMWARPLTCHQNAGFFFHGTKYKDFFAVFSGKCFTDVGCFSLQASGCVGRKPKEFNRSFHPSGYESPPPGMQSEPRKKIRSATDRHWHPGMFGTSPKGKFVIQTF